MFFVILAIFVYINKYTGVFGFYDWRTGRYVQRPGQGPLSPKNRSILYSHLPRPTCGQGPLRTPLPIELRDAVFDKARSGSIAGRQAYFCAYCGQRGTRYGVQWEVDHAVPYSWGGPTSLDNLVLSCRDCNQVKGASIWPMRPNPEARPIRYAEGGVVPAGTHYVVDHAHDVVPFVLPLKP